jgi:hypothetical protein
MSGELKYHYSNPLFDGLPWPADKQEKQPKQKKRKTSCVKKPYSQAEASAESKRLKIESPEFEWSYTGCELCEDFHVVRR